MGVQVISYNMLRKLDSKKKIEKILDVVLKGDIAVVEGRLSPDEELSLTAKAMQNVSGKFPGIEIAFLDSDGAKSFIEKLKYNLVKLLIKDRVGISVVGPSKKIKEIKMDPDKLEILFK